MRTRNFRRSAVPMGHPDGVGGVGIGGVDELWPMALGVAEVDVELKATTLGCTSSGAVTVGGTAGALG
jgi:hypothetical protein